MKKTNSGVYILTALMLALFIVSLLPFFYASLFCHPILDDFSYSSNVHNSIQSSEGFLQVLKSACHTVATSYIGWQGTFTAIFLFAFQPGVFSQEMYFITTVVMVCSLSLATFFLIDTILVLCFKAERAYSILISCAVLFCTFQFLVNIPEALFWWNGSVYYTFFHALALFLFSLIIRMYVHTKGCRRSLCFVLALFLAFIIGGGNYSTALFSFCIIVIALFFLTKIRAEKLWQYYLVLFILISCLFISVIAPGNSVRAEYFDGYNPIKAIWASVYYSFYYIGNWTKLPQVILFVFVSPFLYSVARKVEFDYKYPAFALLLSFLCFAAQLTPPLYAMQSPGAGRQINIYYCSYYLLVLFNMFYLSGWFAKREIIKLDLESLFKARVAAPFFVILVLLFISGCDIGFSHLNSVNVWKSLKSGEMWQYEQEYMSLIKQVQNGENDLSDIKICPSGIFYNIGLSEDWVAEAVAGYYGVEPFRVTTPTDSTEVTE